MLEYVKDIIFIKRYMLSKEEYFRLEINENENVLKYIDEKYQKPANKIIVENDVVECYIKDLFRIIDGWENSYFNDNIIDGLEWNLKITLKDGEIRYYYGKNDFPSNFDALDIIKDKIIESTMEKN